MKNITGMLAAALGLVILTGTAAHPTMGEIKKIDLTPGKDRSLLILHFEGNGRFRVFQSERQGNVIVEAENLSLPASLTKLIDASTSDGPVIQLTPYSSGTAKRLMSKFVLQLRGQAEVTSSELPGKFILELKKKTILSQAQAKKNQKLPTLAKNGWSEKDELRGRAAANDKSEETAKKLVDVLNAAPEEKTYFGSRVTFEGNAVDVHDVFRLVGEASGLNIITDSNVKYQSNYSLIDIPWDQLLDIVIQQAQLKAAVTGNVVRIVTLARFNEEQQSKLKELDVADELEPVVMAVVPLSFATAEDMKKMIETLLIKRDRSSGGARASAPAADPNAGGGANAAEAGRFSQDFVRGELQVDSRSNSLIITNTKETIERIRKLVRELDVALPQVLIDAKIIIAQETFTRSIGVAWGGRATSTGSGRAGIGAGFAGNPISLGDGLGPAFQISPATGDNPGGAIGFRVGAGRHGNLNAQLSLAEANGVSKTVASPRVIVNNKVEAQITDGLTSFLSTVAGPNASGELKEIKANLNLTVKPQVTSVGSVLLDLNITKDDPVPDSSSITNKSMKTQVLVDSGSTLVLGGVYQFAQSKGEKGIPLLKDLPFIGQMFRTDSSNNAKNEMMVFITPQIIGVEDKAPGANESAAL